MKRNTADEDDGARLVASAVVAACEVEGFGGQVVPGSVVEVRYDIGRLLVVGTRWGPVGKNAAVVVRDEAVAARLRKAGYRHARCAAGPESQV